MEILVVGELHLKRKYKTGPCFVPPGGGLDNSL